MQFERFADHAGLNDLDGAAQAGLGAALVAHLSGQVLLFGELAQEARLVDGLDERFLAKAVLAHLHRPDGRHAVVVVRDGNGHRVNVLADFVQHLAVIAVLLELGELLRELPCLRAQGIPVHVADGDNVAAAVGGAAAVAVAFAADADAGDVDAVIGPQHAPDIREREGTAPAASMVRLRN